MPTYDYGCKACGHEFEREQRITDDPVKTCPECRSRKVKKLISQTSFVLKGGGWYADAYSSRSGKSEGDSGGDGDAKSSDAKSDDSSSKSEKKSDKKKAKKSSGKSKDAA